MGKLAEKMSQVAAPKFGLPCGMSTVLNQMDEEDRQALEIVLFVDNENVKRLSNRQIYEILISENYNVAQSSIAQHRRKQCRCFSGMSVRMNTVTGN